MAERYSKWITSVVAIGCAFAAVACTELELGGDAAAAPDVGGEGGAGGTGNMMDAASGGTEAGHGGTGAAPEDGAVTMDAAGGDSGETAPDAAEAGVDAGDHEMTCLGQEMVELEEVTFAMGADDLPESQPVKLVTVGAFEIDRTEVTVEAYGACVDDGACTQPGIGGLCNWGFALRACHPVNCVSWDQANAYCAWAGKELPTEEQWERAARGEEARPFPWNAVDPASSELLQWNTDLGTAEVGAHPRGATPEGVYDLAGNVWEWTATLWCDSYAQDATCSPTQHVDRGGSWASAQEVFVRSAFRETDPLDGGDARFGFRCVR